MEEGSIDCAHGLNPAKPDSNNPFSYCPIRRKYAVSDSFFDSGDSVYSSNDKSVTFDDDTEDFLHRLLPEFSCHIAGCMVAFTSVQQYEIHYNTLHRHVCSSCKKLFPTNYLLELHMLESHDSLFLLLAEKQNMFQCLVEGCNSKFKDESERKSHLTECHHYPHNFRFGKSKQKVSLKPNSDPVQDSQAKEIKTMKESDTDQIVIKYAPKVPKHICFGQGSTRGFMPRTRGSQATRQGKGRPWHQVKNAAMDTSVSIEEVSMSDLCDALP